MFAKKEVHVVSGRCSIAKTLTLFTFILLLIPMNSPFSFHFDVTSSRYVHLMKQKHLTIPSV